MQTLRVNNSRILRTKNAKFSGYYFYLNTDIWGDFQIYISVPLIITVISNKTIKIMSKFHSILSAKASFLVLSAEKMRTCGNSKQIFQVALLVRLASHIKIKYPHTAVFNCCYIPK